MASGDTGRLLTATAWDAAYQSWAADADCENLNTEDSSEFNQVWIASATYGLLLITLITVARFLCSDPDTGKSEAATLVARIKTWRKGSEGSLASPHHGAAFEDTDPKPNIGKAREHLKQTTPHNADGRKYGVFWSGRSTLRSVGGTGLDLYFIMLRHLGFVFCLMSAMTAPIVVYSWHGNFAPDIGSALTRTTIGNLGYVTQGGVEQEFRHVVMGCETKPLRDLTPILAWLDFCSLVVFLGFVIWFRFWSIPRAISKSDDQMTTVSDFAVEIDHLPREVADHAKYADQLRAHLHHIIDFAREQMNAKGLQVATADNIVHEVVLVRDYKQGLESIKRVAELKKAKEIAEYKGETPMVRVGCKKVSIDEVIQKKEQQLSAILKPEEQLPVLRAFVIVNTQEDVQGLLHIYRFSRTFFRTCIGEKLRFNGKAIRVRAAPEPSDILWTNQDTPWMRRLARRSIMFSVWLLVMIISVVLVYLTSHAGRQLGPDAGQQVIGDSESCDAGTKTSGYVCNAVAAAKWTKDEARNFQGDVLNCYCTTQGYQEIVQDDVLREDICDEWLRESAETIAVGFGTAIIIVVINVVLRELVNAFSAWEKPASLSALNSSVMFKVAVSQIINTSLIIFVLNFNGFFLTKLFDMEGDYSDFDRGWYATVGGAILTNMVLNSFMAPISSFSKWFLAKLWRCWCCRRNVGHQAELLELYTNPPFEISERYAQMLTTVFCTVIYSAGLPLLNGFAVIYFFLSYWSDRIIVLRGSRKPPAYNLSMPLQASSMLLYAAPLHALLALFMYSHPCTFPSSGVGTSFSDTEYGSNGLEERIKRRAAWMMFAILLIMVALYALWILEWIFGGLGRLCLKYCCACFSSSGMAKVEPDTSGDEEAHLTWKLAQDYIEQVRPPTSFSMGRHPDFQPLMRYLPGGENSGQGEAAKS